ncbi:MAG: ParA family protein [Halieaceae bacterium]
MLRRSQIYELIDLDPTSTPTSSDAGASKFSDDHGVSPGEAREILSRAGLLNSARTISFINLKGGTGKTTSAVTTATRASEFGFRVVVLDLDAQASATFMLAPQEVDQAKPFIEIWDKPTQISDILIKVSPWLSLLPSSLDNSLLDIHLSKPLSQKTAIRDACSHMHAMGHDLVVIDCPPSLGAGVISAICASDTLVIPTTPDNFSLRGIDLTIEETGAIAETFGLPKPQIKILLTHYDRRIKLSDAVYRHLQDKYADMLIKQPIRISSAYAQAQEQGKTVFQFAKAKKVQADYHALTTELLRLNGRTPNMDS